MWWPRAVLPSPRLVLVMLLLLVTVLPLCTASSWNLLRHRTRSVRAASVVGGVRKGHGSGSPDAAEPHVSTEAHETERYDYCVEREEVEEHHGIQVAAWRWNEVQTYYAITLFIVIAGLAKLGFHHAQFLSSKLPESCLLIILGTFMGIVTYHIRHRNDDASFPVIRFENGTKVGPCEDEFSGFFPKFDAELFFLVLLPPIVLEASYSLHDRTFANNLGTVLLFAVVGTLFNMFIIGPALYGLAVGGAMGTSMIPDASSYDISQVNLVEMLTFASLIVAVDPVAVLSIFQEVGVNKDLYFLVFGESLLNDAVTVVLYNAMVVFTDSANVPVTYDQVLLAVVAFFCVSLGGLAIGIVFGLLTAVVTKFTPDVRVVEPLSLLAMAYLSYLTAELVHFSGIIATVGCGVVQAHYAMKNISKNSYITIKYFITMASSTSDTIIFMFLGMVLISDEHEWHTGFALWTLVLCLVVRFIGVYLLTWLANFRRLRRIGLKEQFIMAYGGLRGAVGFSLVVMLRDTAINVTTVRIFITTTLFIILFTVFIQGSTIKLLVNLFHIKLDESDDPTLVEEIADTTVDHITAGVEEIIGYHGANAFKERLEHLDDKYLKPVLISDASDTALARLYDKLVLDEHYANLYGPAAAADTEKGVLSKATLGDADFFLPEEDLVHLRRRSQVQRQASLASQSAGTPSDRAHPLSRMESFRQRWGSWRSSSSITPNQQILRTGDVERQAETAPTSPTTPVFNPEDNYKTYPNDESQAMLRRAFNSNPYNKLHLRYNPNLIDEEDQEISTHLRRRRANAQRFSQIGQLVAAQSRESQSSQPAMRRAVSDALSEQLQLRMPGVASLVMDQRRRALERQRSRHFSAGSTPGGGPERAASTPTSDYEGYHSTAVVLGPIAESESELRSSSHLIAGGRSSETAPPPPDAESREMLPRAAPVPAPRNVETPTPADTQVSRM